MNIIKKLAIVISIALLASTTTYSIRLDDLKGIGAGLLSATCASYCWQYLNDVGYFADRCIVTGMYPHTFKFGAYSRFKRRLRSAVVGTAITGYAAWNLAKIAYEKLTRQAAN